MPKYQRESGRRKKQLRPPPNYFARRTQMRLLVLVGLLMGVVVAIPIAADPANYAWMGFKQPAAGEGGEQGEPDTRLPADGLIADDSPSKSAVVAVANLTADEPRDALYLARKDAWNDLLLSLTRQQRDLLNRGLRHLRLGEPMSLDDRADWLLLVNRFDQGWQAYLEKARASLADLPPSQREAWTQQLDVLDSDWTDALNPALVAALEDRELSPDEHARIDRFQRLLDRLALAMVEDDAPYQAVERDAWFRMLELLRDSPETKLEDDSLGEVGYLQLFRQSDEYRGKLVTIHGRVRQAYRVPAPKNDFGVDAYQVFWIRTDGGPASPIVVYALDVPEGFPELGPQAYADQQPLDEEVEITGFFFKRWAYPAQDGPRTAPLVLAKTARWLRPVQASSEPGGLSPVILASLAVVAALLIAAGVTTFVFVFARGRSAGFRMPSLYAAREGDLQALAKMETAPTIEQSLEQLAHDEEPTHSP
ncbi:MAG: hypothetical protein RIC55_29300 [Pirellulaceae bacterium]